jgi:hypothetical protein
MESLDTTGAVIDELGGNPAVADLMSVKPKTVWHWRDTGIFPSNSYLVITDALLAKGKTAPASLWAMKSANSEPERVA